MWPKDEAPGKAVVRANEPTDYQDRFLRCPHCEGQIDLPRNLLQRMDTLMRVLLSGLPWTALLAAIAAAGRWIPHPQVPEDAGGRGAACEGKLDMEAQNLRRALLNTGGI